MALAAGVLSAILKALSSTKLALAVVLVLIVFSIAGTAIPQKDMVNPDDIARWQSEHPAVTALAKPIGLFHVFTSWPFMATLLLLGVNTLTCSLLHFVKEGGFDCFKGPKRIEKAGFFLLHLSILILLAGGFASTALRLNGYIALTEGQTFVEDHRSYLRLAEGPLRREQHKGFALKLNELQTVYEQGFYQTDVTALLDIIEPDGKVTPATVKINHPYTYKSFAFTHQELGFSPRIEISDKGTGRVRFYSFVMLKTFDSDQGKMYRDYLPLPFLGNRTIVTVYPSHVMKDGEAVKTSEEPDNPLIRIEVDDDTQQEVANEYVALGESVAMGEYVFKFTDLRRWASFQVVDDPGYSTVCVSLWLGLGALLLRYAPDLRKWF